MLSAARVNGTTNSTNASAVTLRDLEDRLAPLRAANHMHLARYPNGSLVNCANGVAVYGRCECFPGYGDDTRAQ